MELRERRLAQIVRDFMEAYALSQEIGRELRAGSLSFQAVARLVGDAEDSALFRLKEECHALFRLDDARPRTEVQAEELFDLAVGALFHESMKFREGFYLTDSYGPRLQRMMAEGSAAGPLAEAFWRVFEAGSRRMLESEAEAEELFRETRDQLLIVLRQLAASGAVARSLVEHPARSEEVFAMPLARLLADIYGSAGRGYQLAIESLIENGHYAEAAAVLEQREAREAGAVGGALPFARGMASYYAGENRAAVDALARWCEAGASSPALWRQSAARVLSSLAQSVELADQKLAKRASALAAELTSARSS
ncbi:MAG TPA: hypothetical protein VMR31_13795 [Myxococcota bacterium]|nr:hypothetical protein [Myxococcota bacterium]